VAGQQGKSRILPFVTMGGVAKYRAVRVGAKFVRHIVPAVIKPLHALWNEVIGFIFLCMGMVFGFYTVRYAIKGDAGRLLVAGLTTCLMVGYGISSFLRARKISRS
jgi:vacuolar-type H+-ATPase subunit I/STV1